MGIVNVTPDSFFATARTQEADAAIERGHLLFEQGADIVDVGGESTRPGATPVDEATELARVLPVVRALSTLGRVSIDTTKRTVAEACVDAGATLVNDVSGTLARCAGDAGVGWVAMHAQGTPQTMQENPYYDDVVAEVAAWFGKTAEHNWTLLRHCDELFVCAENLGAKLLVGTSRKGFLGDASGGSDVDDRLPASLATALVAMETGAGMVRVHDVKESVQAARVMFEMVKAS
jgi:dihydropteroate synthase